MSSLTCFSAATPPPTRSYPWQQCYSAPCNINYNFPALMADSRIWSSWQPEAVINRRIQEENGIRSNWEYRRFLQSNANAIRAIDSQEACYELGMSPHYSTSATPSSHVPHSYTSMFDTLRPGFGYCNSDLKQVYLSREQLNARLIAPTITPPQPAGIAPQW